MKTRKVILSVGLLGFTAVFGGIWAFAAEADGCVGCHGDPGLKVKSKKLHDYFQSWKGSVHEKAKLGCADCHGGDATASEKAAAHAGILPPSDEKSRLHYRQVPETCGSCHQSVYDQFVKSKHYKKLRKEGTAPNCVTCHGSMNSRTDEKEILAASCRSCHNKETGNRPEIVTQAEKIIERLSYAEGYRKWAKFYYKSIGKSEKLDTIDPLYENILTGWHSFDFRQVDWDSRKLLFEVKTLFEALSAERSKNETEKSGE
ncbi:MAG: hypothetical protein AUJ52_11915 [Elusimicrobia bacterium CG1_02_63_36]|nr:MAG: hypothetical protein AUJ52_11915 [Elusimicrobia bacterium CG1_02_63_36]PIP83753.1 MAG: hypothetical protein COR54_07835 [Elusimicrobia bacterium CG22_combo_CG10-13_8_21_14_all_63_91]PJA12030.1 MAG: hypothetical protein COX66_18310 [Elusimicrobia bacterium CG_4_10_14_0_2_um_filter_63_34]PJB25930.1 MAG: hypothetical protein CO113_06155 [Elusimicrobia bacterium CG_4_9_14_3_um_filter_62_55]